MQLQTYLNFGTNCAQAFAFYQGVFGGELTIFKVSETPGADHFPPESQDMIMYAKLAFDGQVLLGSDCFSGGEYVPSASGIQIECDSREQVDSLFAALSENGEVTCPAGDQFWGGYFGACKDEFGVPWMINYQVQEYVAP